MKNLHSNTLLFITLILLCGCSFDQQVEYRIDPDFEKHVNTFFEEAAKRGLYFEKVNLTVTYGPTNAAGTFKIAGDQRVILINRAKADQLRENRRDGNTAIELIIFHEMGHGLLNKGHSKEGIMQASGDYFLYAQDSAKRESEFNRLFDKL
jgi:hypothetical protein